MDDNDSALPATTDIAYGGTIIARLEAGQTATLPCARKWMKHDVYVQAGSGSGGGRTISADASVVDVVSSRINLNLPITVNAGAVDVISTKIDLKRPIITTNIIVEETE